MGFATLIPGRPLLAAPDTGLASRVNYNVDFIPAIGDFMKRRGLSEKLGLPFEIGIDREKPVALTVFDSNNVKSDDGRRMFFSSWR